MSDRVLPYNGLVIGTGAGGPVRGIPALTNGQLAIGKTGYPPVPATITGAGGISVTAGAGTLALNTRGYVTTTAVGNVLTGEDTLATWSMPANTIIADSGLHAVGEVLFAANANTKAVKFYVGGTSWALNTTTAPNDRLMLFDLYVFWFTNATTIRWVGTATLTGAALDQATPVLDRLYASSGSSSIDLTTTTTVKVTGEATATNDIQLLALTIQAFRTP